MSAGALGVARNLIADVAGWYGPGTDPPGGRYTPVAPARILGLDAHGGPIEGGRPANLVVFHPGNKWTVDPSSFASKSRNTPFAGMTLTGRVRHTLLGGEAVVVDAEAQR